MEKELIEELNEKGITQTEYADEGFVDSEDVSSILSDAKLVESDLDVDKHRWYETSLYVYKLEDGFLLGIRAVSDIFSEMSGLEDIDWDLNFQEMERVQAVTYKVK